MSNIKEVRSLAVYGNYLYWVDTSCGNLNRVNKLTGQDKELIRSHIDKPTDVLIVNKHSFDGKFLCFLVGNVKAIQ